MGYFRHPKTQNERKGDQAFRYEDDAQSIEPKGCVRSGKNGHVLPAERDDTAPAANKDRSRDKVIRLPPFTEMAHASLGMRTLWIT